VGVGFFAVGAEFVVEGLGDVESRDCQSNLSG